MDSNCNFLSNNVYSYWHYSYPWKIARVFVMKLIRCQSLMFAKVCSILATDQYPIECNRNYESNKFLTIVNVCNKLFLLLIQSWYVSKDFTECFSMESRINLYVVHTNAKVIYLTQVFDWKILNEKLTVMTCSRCSYSWIMHISKKISAPKQCLHIVDM